MSSELSAMKFEGYIDRLQAEDERQNAEREKIKNELLENIEIEKQERDKAD